MNKGGVSMAIVQTYHYGGVTVHVDDDAYKNRTPEQIRQSIKELSAIVISAHQRSAKRDEGRIK